MVSAPVHNPRLNLSIEIEPNSGFCFGVVYAVEMAEEILDREGHLYCLGDIVHNGAEIDRLKAKGLVIIDHQAFKGIRNEKVLIRAHGEPPSTYRIALENNIQLVDASCPVVLKLQDRIRSSFDQGKPIYILGKHGHAEVLGLIGQTEGKAAVFQDWSEIDHTALPEKVALFSQTTKSKAKFYEAAEKVRSWGVQVEVHDTICRQVSHRDDELRKFSSQFDKVIFVSGAKSSNGKVLYLVCKEANPNSYFVSSTRDVGSLPIEKNDRIGICGATSTPLWLMKEVQSFLATL